LTELAYWLARCLEKDKGHPVFLLSSRKLQLFITCNIIDIEAFPISSDTYPYSF
jgi:hypothetical protein